ncbi:MAG TPA: hypothetical protein PLV88_00270 [Methanoregulaceae archaeon]|jgi:branched-subunit amino acid transport protein|nr:hypothetical protein [Burkholderiaceae bacterium]NLH25817.1 hypothetical protein [Methanomicrobiales archaeon]HNB02699.1 hypothetical protein [Methanoregulaceae archaeon]HNJ80890.1 hypothetical protein [Methanoregulaceae archaeon]HNW80875.1 hypothetical protein [Methanoregulaceae archaeon]
MSDKKWTLMLATVLIALSAVLYILHFFMFHDPHHIGMFLLGDLAFLPIEVLLVTLILHQLLENRDREMRLDKLNMVIGTFFSSMGTTLLAYFSDRDPQMDGVRKSLRISESWSEEDFTRMGAELSRYPCMVTIKDVDMPGLRNFLLGKEDFLMRLLENPLLIEHESFTDMLQGIFHLTSELTHRKDLTSLPANDQQHLTKDICRAYHLLIIQWLGYMRYLKQHYPYLFSLALRTNPFDEEASVIIR